jgi:Leucine-rich repeat (LRR) protein
VCISILIFSITIQAQSLPNEPLKEQKLYTSLKEALQNPEQVYRLNLKLPRKCDSIPEEVFQLTNLQELRLTGCHLNIINRNIGKLQSLRFLHLNRNNLVRLPEEFTQLTHLVLLDISRNPLMELPESMGNMKSLEMIDAWDTQLFVLPESIAQLAETLKVIDLRQVPLKDSEHVTMQQLLPQTSIPYSYYCDCNSDR